MPLITSGQRHLPGVAQLLALVVFIITKAALDKNHSEEISLIV